MKASRVEQHPDPAWQLDEHAQRQLIEFAPRFWRRLFGCLLGTSGVMVTLGVLQSRGIFAVGASIAGWIFLGGFFVVPVLLLWFRSRPMCSACGRAMRRESIYLEHGGGDDRQFMVCHACKRYADTLFDTGG